VALLNRKNISDWIAAEGPKAVAYCRSIIHDHQGAEDVVQETFAALLRGGYDLANQPVSLLYRSLTNRCFNYLRDNRRARPQDFEADDAAPLVPATADHDDPAVQMEKKELEAAIEAAFEALPARQRAALHLRVRMEQSHEEIAEALGTTSANAQVLVHRARAALKKLLEGYL
jgi:RNA polymerase sigma-70 factor (ECF subfamily)